MLCTQCGEILHKKAWLFKVLRNLLLDHAKESYNRNKIDLEEIAHLPGHTLDFEAALQEKERYREILQILTPRELECVRLRAEGFEYQEIADLMKIRKGTVGALLTRAIRKMQKRN